MDTPHSYGPAEPATAGRDDLRFPLVVKPLVAPKFVARFRSKLGVARDRDELERWISEMGRARIPGLVMDLVPGADSDIYAYCAYLDQSGAPVGRPAGAKAAPDTSRLRRRPGGGDRGRATGTARGHGGDRPPDGPSRDRQRGVQARLPRRPVSLLRDQRALDDLQRPASAGRPRSGRLGLVRSHGRWPSRGRARLAWRVDSPASRRAALDSGESSWPDGVRGVRGAIPPTEGRGRLVIPRSVAVRRSMVAQLERGVQALRGGRTEELFEARTRPPLPA